MYVNWTPNTYKITYNANGGTGAPAATTYTYAASGTVALSSTKPTKTGYTFIGWGTSADETTVKYQSGASYNRNVISNITLYALYIKNVLYVKYDMNGGYLDSTHGSTIATSGSVVTINGNQTVKAGEYGDKIATTGLYDYNNSSAINIKKTGYIAKSAAEWNTSANGSGKSYNQATQYNVSDFSDFADLSSGDKTVTLYVNWTPQTYTISYDLDGGVLNNKKTSYNIETATFEIGNPSKTGYTFIGWTGSNGTTPQKDVTIQKGSTGNKTYSAKYEENRHTIEFNSNGGSSVSSINALVGETIKEPTSPTKEGFRFAGWYSNPELTQVYTFTTMPDKDIELYAKWTESENIITYKLNGGTNSELNTSVYKTGEEVELYDAYKKGYDFAGWYLDSNYNNRVEKISSSMTGDITLHAKYVLKEYAITFDSRGGTTVESIKTEYGKEIEKPEDPTKQGYIFKGWYSNPELTQGYTFTTMPDKDIKLYAKWEENYHTVSFETNGGEELSEILILDGDKVVKPNNPEKEGHKFENWYTDPELTVLYDFDNPVSNDIVLYAKYERDKLLVTFNNDGDIESTEVLYNEKVNAPKNPEKEGYKFIGWYTEEDDIYDFDDHIIRNIQLHAKYEAEEYIIEFETNGGTWIDTMEAMFEEKIHAPKDPTKEGYNFAGWYSDKDLTKLFTFAIMPSHNLKLYAKYTPGENIISYEVNGGINNVGNPSIYVTGEEKELLKPEKEGHKFIGWYTDENLEHSIAKISKDSVGNIELYAKWERLKYTISFESNEGTPVEKIEALYEEEIESPENPEREDYIFVGWYSDESLLELYSFNTMPAENITLYAKWAKEKYVIKFNTNGGSNINNLSGFENDEVIRPNDPIREGYKFAGWYIDDQLTQLYNFRIFEDNVTLYAKWVSNDASVIDYTTNGENNDPSNPTDYHSNQVLKNPTREGEMCYWVDEHGRIITNTSQLKGDVKLHAECGLVGLPDTGISIPKLLIVLGTILIFIGSTIIVK